MARSTNTLSKTFVWILLAFLIVGLAGFGAINFGGRMNSVGTVGDKEISVNDYARALQNQMNAASAQFGSQISFQQAQMFGIQQQALSRLVVEKTLEHEADALGISAGDETVRDKLMTIRAFQGVDGSFDRTAYTFALQNAGLSETDFEKQLRDEAARELIQQAIATGVKMPSAFADSAIKYILEERDIALLELDERDLPTPIGEPTEDQLKSYYDDNIDLFSLPESKSITYAILTPDMMVETIPVEDSDLLALYEKNIDTYKKPERRLVERLNFLDYEDAQRAAQRLQSGEVDFEGLVSERGLTLSDIDLGDVTLEELSDAGETVFALSSGAITAPLKTDLGAAIYRVNGILNAQETPFDEVKEDLKRGFSLDRAQRLIENEQTRLDDLLAAGATLEELANESDMRLETTIYYDGVENDISAYAAFRSAAAGVQETDFPAIIRLADGGILAMRLEEILPTRPEDFTQVRDNVQALWRDSVLRDALGTLGKETLSRAEAGENLVDLGSKFKTMSSLKRNGSTSDASPLVIARAFELDEGTFGQVDGVDSVYVIQLLGISDGDSTTEEARSIEDAFANQLDQGLASDLFQIFVSQVQQTAGVSLNEQALNAVHTNFQ